MAAEDFDSGFEEVECPTCGAIVPPDATECPECGQLFEEEEELWDEDIPEEEMTEEPWEETVEEKPGKGKLYLGFILVLIGGVGLALMSYLHNQIGWYPFGVGGYSGYGPYDQMTGVIGSVLTIIGIVVVVLWHKDMTEYEETSEPYEKGFKDEEFFEDEQEDLEGIEEDDSLEEEW